MTERHSVTTASPFEDLFGFCRGIRVGDTIQIAGTGPIGEDGKTVGVGDPTVQARRCFEIIVRTVEQLGGRKSDIVRTRMFLTRISDWKEVGAVHGEFFREVKPVSTLLQVSELVDPEWFVEMEADALVAPE